MQSLSSSLSTTADSALWRLLRYVTESRIKNVHALYVKSRLHEAEKKAFIDKSSQKKITTICYAIAKVLVKPYVLPLGSYWQ